MYRSMADGRTVACGSCGVRLDPARSEVTREGLVCASCGAALARSRASRRHAAFLVALTALLIGLAPTPVWGMPRVGLLRYEPLVLAASLASSALGLVGLGLCVRSADKHQMARMFRWTVVSAGTAVALGAATALALRPAYAAIGILGGLLAWTAWARRQRTSARAARKTA